MDQIDNSILNEIAETCQVNIDRYFEANNAVCQIEEGLFVGSLGDASNKGALKSSNVTHILTVAKLSVPSFPNDFVYKIIKVMDREETNLMQYFDECFSFIDEAKRLGGGVLVHCFMGISRRCFSLHCDSGCCLSDEKAWYELFSSFGTCKEQTTSSIS
ncbi:hypothetical protein CRYUN_Cryun40dG0050700 [Craigia yunnanensis]